MDQALISAAVQVPAVLIVSITFLKVIEWVLNRQGDKMDRLSAAVEEHLRRK